MKKLSDLQNKVIDMAKAMDVNLVGVPSASNLRLTGNLCKHKTC